jgi:hypothetical protein
MQVTASDFKLSRIHRIHDRRCTVSFLGRRPIDHETAVSAVLYKLTSSLENMTR